MMAKKLIWIDQQEPRPRPRQDDLAPIYSITHTFSKWLLIIRLIIMIISSSTTTTVHLEIPHLFVGFTNWPAADEDPTISSAADEIFWYSRTNVLLDYDDDDDVD